MPNREKDSKKLAVNPEDAKLVKEIFELYLQGNSLLKVAKILNDQGHRTKFRVTRKGTNYGGKKFGVTQIQHLLKNVLYIGKVDYAGQIYDGQQPAIVDEETFKKVQQRLAENRVTRRALKNIDCSGLLTRLLKCKACGTMMIHTYTLKKGNHKYRYYVCTGAQKKGYGSCPNKSINAQTEVGQRTRRCRNRRRPSDLQKAWKSTRPPNRVKPSPSTEKVSFRSPLGI